MGINDRDYHRNDRREGGGLFAQLTPVVKWLLILNLGIYFLDLFLANAAGDRPIRDFGIFAIQSAVFEGKIWEFITFQFLHGSVGHVLFNCVGIFFFGPWLERWWGAGRFLIFYLLCGVAGAGFFTLLVFLGLWGALAQCVFGGRIRRHLRDLHRGGGDRARLAGDVAVSAHRAVDAATGDGADGDFRRRDFAKTGRQRGRRGGPLGRGNPRLPLDALSAIVRAWLVGGNRAALGDFPNSGSQAETALIFGERPRFRRGCDFG